MEEAQEAQEVQEVVKVKEEGEAVVRVIEAAVQLSLEDQEARVRERAKAETKNFPSLNHL